MKLLKVLFCFLVEFTKEKQNRSEMHFLRLFLEQKKNKKLNKKALKESLFEAIVNNFSLTPLS